MTHIELQQLFKNSGAKQADFVKWANARGFKTRPGDVSNHKRGEPKYPIGRKYAEAYRDFFAERAATEMERFRLSAPAEVVELLDQTINAFGSPDFNPDQVIESLKIAADDLKAKGQPFGSLCAVANAIGVISENAKKLY